MHKLIVKIKFSREVNVEEILYFASQNTAKGFISYFDKVFCEEKLKRLYIIKGGPGTGKSTAMKKAARHWEDQGFRVSRFLCSSDPESLDGVICEEKRVAIIDGTAPHCTDTRFPGCVSEIIDFGDCWDKGILAQSTADIIKASTQKQDAYSKAYGYLRAMGEALRIASSSCEKCIDFKKLEEAAKRFYRKEMKKGTGFELKLAANQSYNHTGLFTIIPHCERLCIVSDKFNSAHFFLEKLFELAKQNEQKVLAGYSAAFPDRLSMLSAEGFGFVSLEVKEPYSLNPYKIINMERFIKKDALQENKAQIRRAKKAAKLLEEEAAREFKRARYFHFCLEEIYKRAMDFEKLDKKIQSLS